LRILLCNDDGVWAEGLNSLARALDSLGEVLIVAPEREQSAASRALTLERPLHMRRLRPGVFSVDGTPTDCILLAVRGVPGQVKFQPDLIVSGINHGPNLGDDVMYSGTVAAAAEGCLMGIPSIAISLASWEPSSFGPAARIARRIVDQVTLRTLPTGTLLNVNIPDMAHGLIQGVRVTRLGRRVYPDLIVEQKDPRGRPCYWIGGERPSWTPEEGVDFAALEEGFVSVTPLHMDLTHYGMLDEIRSWGLDLEPASAAGDDAR
jgi:5'-nucleotidase